MSVSIYVLSGITDVEFVGRDQERVSIDQATHEDAAFGKLVCTGCFTLCYEDDERRIESDFIGLTYGEIEQYQPGFIDCELDVVGEFFETVKESTGVSLNVWKMLGDIGVAINEHIEEQCGLASDKLYPREDILSSLAGMSMESEERMEL